MEAPKIAIGLQGEFTAAELSEIIRDLMQARASLSPEVPHEPPTGMIEDTTILVQEDARFDVRKLATGGLRIWLRNEGIGWMAFTISPRRAQLLREFLSSEDAHRHTSH